VQSARITEGGSLEHDRLLAIFDSSGNFVNGKRFANIHNIRAKYSAGCRQVTLSASGQQTAEFAIEDERRIAVWLSEFFGMTIDVRRNESAGFPDDTIASGPTFVSRSTLETVCGWFSNQTYSFGVDEAIRRFRPNIIIGDAPPFYEDQFNGGGNLFVGDVTVLGTNSCARCVVPTRHPETGEAISGFARLFSDRRKKGLPKTSNPDHFDHYYRLCLNSRISPVEGGKQMSVGDTIQAEWDSFGKIF